MKTLNDHQKVYQLVIEQNKQLGGNLSERAKKISDWLKQEHGIVAGENWIAEVIRQSVEWD